MDQKLTYKNIPVFDKPWFMRFPVIRKARGTALFSKIYLRKDLFDKFCSGNPDVETLSVLDHEATHVERGKRKGVLRTAILYWLFPKIRIEEEMAAIKEEMKILKNAKQDFDFKKRAKNLSGIPYLWAISYKDAYHKLTRLWQEI
ncbi:hypothetical protein HY008_02280 [Candidatus Woesebacteria bacterium]|nr:hypothetical protein [Candidatus Woesebacteria bacterium]